MALTQDSTRARCSRALRIAAYTAPSGNVVVETTCCRRSATVERGDKQFCWQHDPGPTVAEVTALSRAIGATS